MGSEMCIRDRERLGRLGVAAPGEADIETTEPAAASAAHAFLWPSNRRTPTSPGTFSLVLAPNTCQKLLLRVSLRNTHHVTNVQVGVRITEQRNHDEVRTIGIHAASEPVDS